MDVMLVFDAVVALFGAYMIGSSASYEEEWQD
mgnify:CR=1 FL=1